MTRSRLFCLRYFCSPFFEIRQHSINSDVRRCRAVVYQHVSPPDFQALLVSQDLGALKFFDLGGRHDWRKSHRFIERRAHFSELGLKAA
jgi:hypothetical protein